MILKNNFVQGKMNKDLDERLLPKGQYPHAENIRVANTDSSDVGAIENVKGNKQLTNLNLINAKTIGSYADTSNQKLYWMVTSDMRDLVIEYDYQNNITSILLDSTNGLLNFNKNYLITGVVKIINEDFKKDLLIWTDDLNPPRKINIERAKTYTQNGFDEDDISLIKNPPRNKPETYLFNSGTLSGNYIKDKFFRFALRYKYLDGEFSALSSYTTPTFAPSKFDLDYQTLENNGMSNSFDSIKLTVNTGDERVIGFQIVVKEDEGNNLRIIKDVDKISENINNNDTYSYVFNNANVYKSLPEKELYRLYDNVPRLAKALDIVGNRLIFGNYVEGYDLKTSTGSDINIDFTLSRKINNIEGEELSSVFNDDEVTIDLTNIPLNKNSKLTFEIYLKDDSHSGEFNNVYNYILSKDYLDVNALVGDAEFLLFIEEVMTNTFMNNYTLTPPDDSIVDSNTKFSIVSSTSASFVLKTPIITFKIDNTPADSTDNDFSYEDSVWTYVADMTKFYYSMFAINSSVKTNRLNTVGMIYMDKNGRTTPVLECSNNSIEFPQRYSRNQNKILVEINHRAPYWADRYKMVISSNKSDYYTIYSTIFYTDGLYKWVKLEGTNKNKVKEGDTLIIKSDLSGAKDDIITVRVLEVKNQPNNFISDASGSVTTEMKEVGGLYIKIKPSGFNMGDDEQVIYSYDASGENCGSGDGHVARIINSYNPAYNTGEGLVQERNSSGTYIDVPIIGGSKINMSFKVYGNPDEEWHKYSKSFTVQSNWDNFQEWFENEVINLGGFDDYVTYWFTRDTNNALMFTMRTEQWGQWTDCAELHMKIDVVLSSGMMIFETEPDYNNDDIFYELSDTFEIQNNELHRGNISDQTYGSPAIIELDYYNCYVQGNGAETYRYKDAFNESKLYLDIKPRSTTIEKYKEVRRYADLTYSETYNENNNVNGINEFNLSLANFKDDIEKKYGSIQKLHNRDTDLLVFQEDKVSKVMYGRDMLMNADGTHNVSLIQNVLGRHIPYKGEYGISRNPESFTYNGYNIYFTDDKRGQVLRLGGDGLTPISEYGMRQYFKDDFRLKMSNQKIGAFNPRQDQYTLYSSIIRPINRQLSQTCKDTYVQTNFNGQLTLNLDSGYGIGTFKVNIQNDSGNITYKFIDYNGDVVTTGSLSGLEEVEVSATGTLLTHRNYKLIIEGSNDATFTIKPECVDDMGEIIVYNIVVNDDDVFHQINNARYRWDGGGVHSDYKNNNIILTEGLMSLFDNEYGTSGDGNIPLIDSVITIESFKGVNETFDFNPSYHKLGYLISDTLYDINDITTILDNTTYIPTNEIIYPSGNKIDQGIFTFNRPTGNENYLYLIWDYRTKTEEE